MNYSVGGCFRAVFQSAPVAVKEGAALFLSLACLPAWAATVPLSSGATQATLQTAINNAGKNGTVQFSAGNGVTFGNTANAVAIATENVSLKGGRASGFAAGIGSLSRDIIAESLSRPDNLSGIAGNLTQRYITGANTTANAMSFIKPDNDNERKVTGDNLFTNNNKWLRMQASTQSNTVSLANGLALSDLHFTGVKVKYSVGETANQGIVNGLIGNVNTIGDIARIGDLTGNAFTNLSVTLEGAKDNQYLAGGGIIGVRSTANSAEAGKITGNFFSGVSVTAENDKNGYSGQNAGSPYLEGGGLIGLNAASSPGNNPGQAKLPLLENNLFTQIKISSGDIILGGGLIGLNNNSKREGATSTNMNPGAILDKASGNVFGNGTKDDISVKSVFSLRGGGVIGLNGLSSAYVQLGELSSNVFNGAGIDVGSYIKGGGLVGLHTNDGGDGKEELKDENPKAASAMLKSATSNLFLNANVTAQTYLYGGGIVGLRSNAGRSQLDVLENNIFQNLEVSAAGNDGDALGKNGLLGGGIVGVSSKEQGYIANVLNNWFDGLSVSSSGHLKGGGILGAQADDSTTPVTDNKTSNFAVISNVAGNTFSNIKVETAEDAGGAILGGGIIGVWNSGGANGLQRIDHNRFRWLSVKSDSYLSGGGIVGAWANEGYAVLDTLSNSTFYGYQLDNNQRVDDVYAAEYIEGGGIVGVRSKKAGYIGTIDNTWFAGLKVTAGTYIDGGGIVGATGPANHADNLSIGIHEIVDSVFVNNMITAENGPVMGGLVYSYGLAGGLTITDSWFMDNEFFSNVTSNGYTAAKVYGTVTVDTGVAPLFDVPHTLTLKATSNGSTVFLNNRICEGQESSTCTTDDTHTNSLYFGTIPSVTGLSGSLGSTSDDSAADAKLVIDTASGGGVGLYDPIVVNQNNGKTFDMTVQGSGNFDWGGENVFTVDKQGTVNLNSGTTTLITDFFLNAEQHTFNLAPGARMIVQGNNSMTLASAKLNGTMLFNLYNTTANKSETALLTLHNGGGGEFDITGSVIRLSNFKAGDPLLGGGDRFYLIATDADGVHLTGDPLNNRAYARQGLLIGYNFIIDKEPLYGSEEKEGQYLVARLVEEKAAVGVPLYVKEEPQFKAQVDDPLYVEFETKVGDPLHVEIKSEVGEPLRVDYTEGVDEPPFVVVSDPPVAPIPPDVPDPTPATPVPAYVPPTVYADRPPIGPADETTVLVGGRAAGLAFLAQWGGWLPDHSYQAADLALDENRSERTWVPYGGVDAGRWHLDTGSHIKLTGSSIQLGLATRHRGDSGAALFGVFLETKQADYSTRNRFAYLSDVDGDGDLDAVGGGLMGRYTWNNDLRIEASLRTGRLKNDFRTKNYVDYDGIPARYKTTDRYLAAHLGVGRLWQVSEKNDLDLLFRYYWTHLKGDKIRLGEFEEIHFDDSESRRVRLGGRLTHTWEKNRFWYVGLAAERELDSQVNASAHAKAGSSVVSFNLDAHEFKGTTTLGEIGIIIRSKKNSPFSLEAGLQGYAGKFRGVSGGIRVGWEF